METARGARQRPTIREVALAAGVSSATVSRVLNGGHWVSEATQRAVQQAVEKTGYSANATARSLATGRANSLAFLITEQHRAVFTDPTFAVLMREAAHALSARQMTLLLLVASTPEERASVARYVQAGHVDGVMLISRHESDPLLQTLIDAGVPTVTCGLPLGYQSAVPSASVDEAGSAIAMTHYLMNEGHRRIAMIAGPQDTPGGRYRLQGFREALGDRFDEELVAYGDYSMGSGAAATAELLERGPAPDAIFAASDAMAAGAIVALSRAGLSVPEDVAVAGFDDSGLAAEHDPPITTMRQPWAEISEAMVSLLLDTQPSGEGPRHVVLDTELVVRASA